jgi:hypothetical protein
LHGYEWEREVVWCVVKVREESFGNFSHGGEKAESEARATLFIISASEFPCIIIIIVIIIVSVLHKTCADPNKSLSLKSALALKDVPGCDTREEPFQRPEHTGVSRVTVAKGLGREHVRDCSKALHVQLFLGMWPIAGAEALFGRALVQVPDRRGIDHCAPTPLCCGTMPSTVPPE